MRTVENLCLGAKNFNIKFSARTIKMGAKICKLKIHEPKLHEISTSVNGTDVKCLKCLESKFIYWLCK